MKRQTKTQKIKIKPRRLTRAERKQLKYARRANAELKLCQQALAFHKEYLAFQVANEAANIEELTAQASDLLS